MNTTLQATETKKQTVKLIDGCFTKKEALSILNSVLDVKINFHKVQRLSKTEGNINDACVYDNSRIIELLADKKLSKEFLKSLESLIPFLKV